MWCLAAGHGMAHLLDQGFPLFLTEIASVMGLSTVQKGSLFAIRQVGFGVVSISAGPFVDMLKRQWGLILTGTMLWAAVSQASIGASPNFAVLFIAVGFLSVPGSLWHLPATAAVSQRFPDRRGVAISIHGFGGNVGNVLGPLLAGSLLVVMYWRHIFFIYVAPSLLLAAFVWWSLKDLGREGPREEDRQLGARLQEAGGMLKDPVLVGLVLVAMLRGTGVTALLNWTPFYLEEELNMGHFEAGVHYMLVSGMGIVAAPVLGALSDRYGRKRVLVPGLLAASAFSLLVVSAGDSFMLPVILACMGLFSFALHQIIQAAVLDVAGRGTEATTIGLLFGLNGVVGGVSPFVASAIIDHLGGYGSIFYYAGILTAIPALLMIIIPLRARGAPAVGGS